MALRTISSKAAAEIDKELMSSGAFSIDQLMELAGSVERIRLRSPTLTFVKVYKVHPPSAGSEVLICCGPGNNGGDGLVCARYLRHYSYTPTLYYPKQSTSHPLYGRLLQQCKDLKISMTKDFHGALASTDHVVDAIFGFSFSGPVREPFPEVIESLAKARVGVTSVDAPSGWDIETGPPKNGPASEFMPDVLVSLTAPKPLVKYFTGRHFVGGRFVTPDIAERWGFEVPKYPGIEQVVEVSVEGQKDYNKERGEARL